MTKNILIILFFLLFQSSYAQVEKESFDEFINKFTLSELPRDLNSSLNKGHKSIDSIYIVRYICKNILNNCYDTYIRHYPAYSYCERFEVSKKFHILTYHTLDYPTKETQHVLMTISKKDKKTISKLVVSGNRPMYYHMNGKINNDLTIELKTLYSYETFHGKPDYGFPEYFWIDEVIDKYKISKKGEISFVKRISDKKYIAREGTEDRIFDYPVEIPVE